MYLNILHVLLCRVEHTLVNNLILKLACLETNVFKRDTQTGGASYKFSPFPQALTKFLNLYDFLYLEPRFHVVP